MFTWPLNSYNCLVSILNNLLIKAAKAIKYAVQTCKPLKCLKCDNGSLHNHCLHMQMLIPKLLAENLTPAPRCCTEVNYFLHPCIKTIFAKAMTSLLLPEKILNSSSM